MYSTVIRKLAVLHWKQCVLSTAALINKLQMTFKRLEEATHTSPLQSDGEGKYIGFSHVMS